MKGIGIGIGILSFKNIVYRERARFHIFSKIESLRRQLVRVKIHEFFHVLL